MVLTPQFTVSQTDELVVVKIVVPFIRVSAAEIISEGCNFSFYCKPYILKLTFPELLQDGEDAHRAIYDPDDNNGTLTIEMKKQTVGMYFPDLDLITKLIKTRKVTEMTPDVHDIELLHNENFVEGEEEESNTVNDNLLNWTNRNSYGFNGQYRHVFNNLREMMFGVLEVNEPDKYSAKQRYQQRIAQEYTDFDAARYLGDLLDGEQDPLYSQMMEYKPFWIIAWENFQLESQSSEKQLSPEAVRASTPSFVFEEFENEILRNKLKNKEYLLSPGSNDEMELLVNMIDILFALCYDFRMTEGESNNESPANVVRLSRQLSWLDSYLPAEEFMGSEPFDGKAIEKLCLQLITLCMRRVLVYPYLRLWKLGRKILADVARILLLGKRYILKCFLRLFHILERTDSHYLLNKIFVQDYCVWLQSVSDSTVKQLAKAFNNAKNVFEQSEKGKAGKRWVGFHIPELDQFGQTLLKFDQDESSSTEEPDEIPEEFLDYSDIFESSEPELSYLHVSAHVVDESQQESLSAALTESNIESTRAELQAMLLSPSSKASVDTSKQVNRVLIEEVDGNKGQNEDANEEMTFLPRKIEAIGPSSVDSELSMNPSVSEEIQRAMLQHFTQDDSADHSEERAVEEMIFTSLQTELTGERPQPLTEEDVKQLFAAPSSAPTRKSAKTVLIEEISSSTFENTNEEN